MAKSILVLFFAVAIAGGAMGDVTRSSFTGDSSGVVDMPIGVPLTVLPEDGNRENSSHFPPPNDSAAEAMHLEMPAAVLIAIVVCVLAAVGAGCFWLVWFLDSVSASFLARTAPGQGRE